MSEKVSEDELLHLPKLSDGVIFLRPLDEEDATEHLAGEDEEMAKWVSGGRSTPATVEAFIRNNQESWRSGGPRRAFGVFDCASNRLAGFIEVNLARLVEPGQVNVSYGVFRKWRRQGVALRAINLMDEYLQTATEARQMVLRIAPANTASLKLAEKAGFTFCGLFDEPEGRMARYVKDIKS
ncbi:MAG TPA: GNAT family protein [Candidatus Binatia bacterium]|nr:GNAT family protein [Candidatus Binatia bacterium]